MTQYVTYAFATQNGPIPLGQLDQNFVDATNFTATGSGAVTRFSITRLNDFLTDKDFGAAGNGGSDDTAAMQNAAASGKIVVCTGTSYRLSTTVSGLFLVPSTVTYPGAGTLVSTGFAGGGGGMTNPMTTLDDIIVGGTGGTPTRLGVGGTGQFLGINASNNLQWLNPPSGFSNPMTTAGDLIVGGVSGAATRFGIGSNGQVLGVAAGAISWLTVGTGSVTSVGLTLPGIFSVSGTPITTSGTIAATFNTQTANNVFAGPLSGAASAPTFRTIGGQDLQFSATNTFFTQNGAIITRLNDRVFVGGATVCSGNYPQSTNDWLSAFYDANGYTGYTFGAQLGVLTSNSASSEQAILGGARTSQATSANTAAIGIYGVGINNNGTYTSFSWGGYFEGHQTASTGGGAVGIEISTRNAVASNVLDPYNTPPSNTTVALQLSCGAGVTATGQFNGTAAAIITNNPMTWNTGIVFRNGCITANSGKSEAIALPSSYSINWYAAASSVGASITSSVTTGADGQYITFNNGYLGVSTPAGNTLLILNSPASVANYLQITPSATTAPVQISAQGSDTNIDLELIAKGTGLVWIGPYTAGSVTVGGYIEVKDSTGTLRKVPCL